MAQIELIMPKMGESVAEATIIKWLKEEGDRLEAEEPVLEIATDKVDSEVPAPEEGVLVKKLFNEDDVVQVGQAIALIEVAGEASSTGTEANTEDAPAAEAPAAQAAADRVEQAVAATTDEPTSIPRSAGERFYSPLVRSIAEKEGIGLTELESLQGTGAGGRVTKNDILTYLEQGRPAAKKTTPAPAQEAPVNTQANGRATAQETQPTPPPPISIGGQDEVMEMDRMRKLIAEHMVMSKRVSPHVTSFVEADVTNIFRWREKFKGEFQAREGEKITFTPIFIEALAKTIRDFPMINVSVDGDKIVKRGQINVGMAAALPSGNLIVPVIRNADQLNLIGLTKQVNDLARRARENKLKPEEIQGGTYTITNVGTFGNVMGTPIINQPQVAIMATGSINKKPAVIETPEGDMIGIRYKMFLSHSYDHRVVDGALGGQFVRRMADYLEGFDPNRSI